MPITKERVAAILSAAEDLLQALDTIAEEVPKCVSTAHRALHEGDFKEALNAFSYAVAVCKRGAMLKNPLSLSIIDGERRRLKLYWKGNERRKAKMELKRLGLAGPKKKLSGEQEADEEDERWERDRQERMKRRLAEQIESGEIAGVSPQAMADIAPLPSVKKKTMLEEEAELLSGEGPTAEEIIKQAGG